MVVTTDTVVDVILNVAALNFVSSLDDQAFDIARSGVFGGDLRREAMKIEDTKLPICLKRQSTIRLYWRVMGSTAAV